MSKRKREEIVFKAEPIFARFGFKKTTMDNIAENINLRKSTLYYYFKSKEEIFFAVIEKECNVLKKNILENIKEADSPKDKLKFFFLTRLKNFEKLAEYYSAFNKEYFDAFETGEKIFKEYFLWEEKTIEKIINTGIKKGIFKKEKISVPEVVSSLTIILKGFEHKVISENDPALEKKIAAALEIIFKGIAV